MQTHTHTYRSLCVSVDIVIFAFTDTGTDVYAPLVLFVPVFEVVEMGEEEQEGFGGEGELCVLCVCVRACVD